MVRSTLLKLKGPKKISRGLQSMGMEVSHKVIDLSSAYGNLPPQP